MRHLIGYFLILLLLPMFFPDEPDEQPQPEPAPANWQDADPAASYDDSIDYMRAVRPAQDADTLILEY